MNFQRTDKLSGTKVTKEASLGGDKPSVAIKDAKWSLSDIILSDNISQRIEDLLLLFRKIDILEQWGLFNSKLVSACFHGPPGTGKTTTAEAVANELNLGIIDVNYAQLESKFHGETSKNIKRIFSEAKDKEALLFWDEADTVLSHRISDVGSSTDASINLNRTTMLKELEIFEGIVIFATNLPSSIDFAFRRRIRNFIEFNLPDEAARKKIFEKFLRLVPKDDDTIDRSVIEKSDGMSGSDIENTVIQAAITTLRLGNEKLSQNTLMRALEETVNAHPFTRMDSSC